VTWLGIDRNIATSAGSTLNSQAAWAGAIIQEVAVSDSERQELRSDIRTQARYPKQVLLMTNLSFSAPRVVSCITHIIGAG